jgi:hypothetical protein
LLRCFVHNFANAKFVKQARDKAKMIQDLTAVGVFHVISSPEEIRPTPKIAQIPSRVCGMSATEFECGNNGRANLTLHWS